MLRIILVAVAFWAYREIKKRKEQKLRDQGMTDEQIKQAADTRTQTIILIAFLIFLVSFLVAGLRTM